MLTKLIIKTADLAQVIIRVIFLPIHITYVVCHVDHLFPLSN